MAVSSQHLKTSRVRLAWGRQSRFLSLSARAPAGIDHGNTIAIVQQEPPALDLDRLIVISPHLDDAVLSSAHLLAAARSALVITLFGGIPDRYPAALSRWDIKCGFRAGDDIMAQRREEDAQGLEALGARPRVLDLLDIQYRRGRAPGIRSVAALLAPLVDEWRPTTVAMPLGLGHPDHLLAHAATVALRRRRPSSTWVCYAEFPYLWRKPDVVARRMAYVRRRGYSLTPVLNIPQSAALKAKALACYRSQILGLAFDIPRVAAASEMHWVLDDRATLSARALRRAGNGLRSLLLGF